ncbi:WhiB family redox-sensing transcriptional regulator [Lipingzhangella halophila]|uniref:Transcriptional regulator WhiB n=1 Tax=Lipingzhangella halophila TaxID=1783352 RepID=A0A7W7W2U5_9ACTN|nr:WhiB family transcriptional regulator [Lipingzhangella halophila]MBB4931798.1 WhiB family redox-sensing transcriptional regulator [Lipingzhangella halophila]
MPHTKIGHHKGAARLVRPDWTWQDDAQCRGEDLTLFFGPDGERQPEREARELKAKEICSQCPVRTLCRDDAIARKDLWGVRGGLAPEELTAERKRRMRRAAAGRAAA